MITIEVIMILVVSLLGNCLALLIRYPPFQRKWQALCRTIRLCKEKFREVQTELNTEQPSYPLKIEGMENQQQSESLCEWRMNGFQFFHFCFVYSVGGIPTEPNFGAVKRKSEGYKLQEGMSVRENIPIQARFFKEIITSVDFQCIITSFKKFFPLGDAQDLFWEVYKAWKTPPCDNKNTILELLLAKWYHYMKYPFHLSDILDNIYVQHTSLPNANGLQLIKQFESRGVLNDSMSPFMEHSVQIGFCQSMLTMDKIVAMKQAQRTQVATSPTATGHAGDVSPQRMASAVLAVVAAAIIAAVCYSVDWSVCVNWVVEMCKEHFHGVFWGFIVALLHCYVLMEPLIPTRRKILAIILLDIFAYICYHVRYIYEISYDGPTQKELWNSFWNDLSNLISSSK